MFTLTAKQRENGMVMKTSRMEKKVRRWAQIPGPSSQAAKKKVVEKHETYFNLDTICQYYNRVTIVATIVIQKKLERFADKQFCA